MAMSTKLSVAIHILSLIEIGPPDQVNSELIAASVNTNPVVVRRLMSKLKKAGLIHTSRGATQTYLLKKPEEISLYDIYEAVELEKEVFNIHQNPNPNCLVGANIQAALEEQYSKVQDRMETELKEIPLADVIHQIKN
ncbi:Rrf2 family transcriptional regulator [Enterococcus termitis]|uniref:Transcriptional regulator n=1 Tax=Enterococcus termitis TaxID=332950 RepID=A0A1E5GCW9_9ENTE|nr:Rrf2 family transcriptional regulator [Enterococcus termitis]OEG10554.1 transcriptional regulator [Enterococcus termitis]OJG97805.1 Rrf2 family protein [Enterococcus termitis]